MKAISGQDFGDKETLKQTFNAFFKPLILGNQPVWYRGISPP
jgi:hypothetical protein